MRLMSFAATTDQMRARTKRVTRRRGWKHAKVGMRVMAVVKARGLQRADMEELGVIEFTDVRREPLMEVTQADVELEGFPWLPVQGFIEHFCDIAGCGPEEEVTRIAFRFVDEDQQSRTAH